MKLLSILYELSNTMLDPGTVGVIAKYVNNNKIDKHLPLLKIKDESLKYTGPVLRILALPQSKIKQILAGETITLEMTPVLSWSKTNKGIESVMSNNEAGTFNNSIVIKANLKSKDCIVDVMKFAERYPNIVSNTQYSNYVEEEVISKPFLSKISQKNLDGYFIYSQGYQL